MTVGALTTNTVRHHIALAAIIGLIGAHFALSLHATWRKSATLDEIAHVTGGVAYNRLHDFRIHPENGVVPQRWQALPSSLTASFEPDFDSWAWRHGVTYLVAHRFFYGSENSPEFLLRSARAMNALWGVALLCLIATLAWRWAGPNLAVGLTVLGAFSPTLLAHAGLATSDLAMTVMFCAATLAFWQHLHDSRKRMLALSALTFGLACVTKFSAVLLLPVFVLLAAVRWVVEFRRSTEVGATKPRTGSVRSMMISALVHVGSAVVIIWAAYGFRYAAFAPGLPGETFILPWEQLLPNAPVANAVLGALRSWQALPEAFLYGFGYVLAHADGRGAFLDGELSTQGWFEFFPRTFAYKSTPVELLLPPALLMLALAGVGRDRAADRLAMHRTTPLLVLLGVYWTFSVTSHLNIGHRHILPTYPALLLLAAAAVPLAIERVRGWSKWTAVIPVGAMALQLHSAASIHPHHLAYFNAPSGGPERGYRRLVDSSLDWGQDLPVLADWLRANTHPGEPTYLAYFGSGEPAHYGINATLLPRFPAFQQRRPWHALTSGLYAISATQLQHVYQPEHHPWSAEDERTFQSLRQLEPLFLRMAGRPEEHTDLLGPATPEEWTMAWQRFERLRFARLCHYLSVRPPDAMMGYSILVYRLDATEIQAVATGDLKTFITALEKASTLAFAPELR